MPDGFTSGELEILRGDLAASFTRPPERQPNTFSMTASSLIEETADGVDVSFQAGQSA